MIRCDFGCGTDLRCEHFSPDQEPVRIVQKGLWKIPIFLCAFHRRQLSLNDATTEFQILLGSERFAPGWVFDDRTIIHEDVLKTLEETGKSVVWHGPNVSHSQPYAPPDDEPVSRFTLLDRRE